METVRKTYKEKLRPTPAQERVLDETRAWRCRTLYNTALEQRITAWQRCRVSVSRYEQEAELKAIRAEFPEYAAIHSHVLQDVLARLDKTYQAFFRPRPARREGGLPALQGAHPLPLVHLQGVWQRRTTGQWLPGPVQDRAYQRALVAPDRRHAQDGHDRRARRTAGTSPSPVPRCPRTPCRPPARRPALTWGWSPFATLADGTRILTPRCYRKAERYLRSASAGCPSARRAATAGGRRCLLAKAHQTVRRQRPTSTTRRHFRWCGSTTRSIMKTCRSANMVKNHHLAKSISDAGWTCVPCHPELQSCECWESSGRG